MFQQIYVDALREPAIGYAASYRFERAIVSCPRCGGTVWSRLRAGGLRDAPLARTRHRSIIGLTCEACPWISTYKNVPNADAPPKQQRLNTGPPQGDPDHDHIPR